MSGDLITNVTIVGGGPVGMGLAIELGQRGVDVVVVERDAELHRIPKGQNLTQRTMEHFRVWGVEDQIREARIMPEGFPSAGVNAWDNLHSRYAHPWFRRSQVGAYYFAANERLPQYLTEKVLRERAESLDSVTVLYGEPVTKVEATEDIVSVTTPTRGIESEWVVGCDGSRSVVRDAVGIREEVRDHERRMALLVFRSPELGQLLSEKFDEAAFFNVLHPDLDGYWRFLGMVEVGESWFFHAPVALDATAADLDHETLLYETVGSEFPISLDYVGFWDLRVAIAENYRVGRGIVAGDAAHSHPPYGGYGINTGFEDARNLGWKLAATIQGWGGTHLLDTYSFERRAVFESTATEFIEAFIKRDRKFIAATKGLGDEEFAKAWEERKTSSRFGVSDFAPHYEGSPIVIGGALEAPGAVGVHEFVARAGRHLPPLEAEPGLFDRLNDRFTLITTQSITTSDASVNVVITDRAEGFGVEAVLVRPDHYVAWAGQANQMTQDVIDTSLGR